MPGFVELEGIISTGDVSVGLGTSTTDGQDNHQIGSRLAQWKNLKNLKEHSDQNR